MFMLDLCGLFSSVRFVRSHSARSLNCTHHKVQFIVRETSSLVIAQYMTIKKYNQSLINRMCMCVYLKIYYINHLVPIHHCLSDDYFLVR